MKAIFKTKSNFNNLNGKKLDVIEISGNRISCLVNGQTIDFNIKELVEFSKNNKINAKKF